MRAWDVNLARLMIIVLTVAVSTFGSGPIVAHGATTFQTVVSYRVDGAPNYSAPGNETFWKGISWTSVPLVASVAPGGGHTPSVLVRSANDGFNVYVLFRWNDSQGPSFGSSSEIYRNVTTGKEVSLDPAHTARVTQLLYNSSYYYPDRLAVLWYLGSPGQRQQLPVMQLGSNGSITGGSANIWHWQSVPTDNSPSDTSFPGNYTDLRGKEIFPPNNVSFAENDYTNMTGFFLVGGRIPSAGLTGLSPYSDPFIIRAGNYFSTTNKTWTVEMVRTFSTPDAANYQVQVATGSSIVVAFAVWNGRMGESSHIKSVSQWYNFTITDQSPASQQLPTSPTTGVSLTLALAVGAGLLLVGLIIGFLARPRSRTARA